MQDWAWSDLNLIHNFVEDFHYDPTVISKRPDSTLSYTVMISVDLHQQLRPHLKCKLTTSGRSTVRSVELVPETKCSISVYAQCWGLVN